LSKIWKKGEKKFMLNQALIDIETAFHATEKTAEQSKK